MHRPQKFRPKLVTTGLVIAIMPMIFGLLFIGTLYHLVTLLEKETYKTRRINAAQSLTEKIATGYAQTTIVLIDLGFKNNSKNRKLYLDSMQRVEDFYGELEKFVGKNPREVEAFTRLRRSGTNVKSQFDVMYNNLTKDAESIDYRHLMGMQRFKRDTKPMLEENMAAIRDFVELEKELYKPDETFDETQSRENIKFFLIVGIAINLFISLTIGYLFAGGIVKRLTVITDNSYRLASQKDLNPRLKGDDELAHLDDVFHNMARALQEAHRKEKAIIDSAVDVICSIGKDSAFRSANPAVLSSFGYTENDIIGMPLRTLVHIDDVEQVSAALKQAAQEKTPLTLECRIKHKDGRSVDVLWSMRWSEFDQRFFCVLHDISRKKQLERLKADFLSMVTHDMRTPLFSAMSLMTMIEEGIYGTISSAGLVRVRGTAHSIERLGRLIDDLLDLDKFDSGMFTLVRKDVPIDEVFDKAKQSVSSFAEQQHISIERDENDVSAHLDEDRIVQVLVNLLSNAIKFSPENSSVRLHVSETEDGSRSVKVEVSDNGCGIPEEYLPSIFDRFKQVEGNKGSQKIKGSGLGLAISKAIVEAHGGTIGVDSKVGEGTTFWFTLPMENQAEG